jgi:hypothetical protein
VGRPGAYKSEKRKKEVQRLKKQEEKRQKRVKKDGLSTADGTDVPAEETATDSASEKQENPPSAGIL